MIAVATELYAEMFELGQKRHLVWMQPRCVYEWAPLLVRASQKLRAIKLIDHVLSKLIAPGNSPLYIKRQTSRVD